MTNQDKKTEFRFFSVMEWEKEQEYLRERHKKGWKFIKLTFLGSYHFEKCIPEDVIYQLDYNQEGLAHKSEYVRLFEDCGWEYLQDYAGYSYFRKPVSETGEAEAIFCDEESRMDMLKRVFKGRILTMIIIFFCIIIPQLVMNIMRNRTADRVIAWMFAVLFILYLVSFINFARSFWKFWKGVEK